MKHLSPERFQKAVTWIKDKGRPLEKALVAHYFEDAPLDAVLTALAAYQNPDGGFGHALEPDVRLADSSVIATATALQLLRSLRVQESHPMWRSAIHYLAATYDREKHYWISVPANVSAAPHAPWWEPTVQGGGSLTLNPRSELVGFLFDTFELPESFPISLREQLLEEVVAELESRPNELEQHEIQSAVRLSETESLPAAWKERVVRVLHTALTGAVSRHPDEWEGYVLLPLSVVSEQNSIFYPKYADVIPANIEFLLSHQHSDGFWSPPWSWTDDRIAWETVENDLRSLITWQNLDTMRRFDAIDMKTA